MKSECSPQIFQKYWIIEFNENPSSVNRVVHQVWSELSHAEIQVDEQTDHDQISNCFSQLCERA
jgi:hypothetical protein